MTSGEEGGSRRSSSEEGERTTAAVPDAPLCDLCGATMRETHCKLICDQCGYTRDCSDP